MHGNFDDYNIPSNVANSDDAVNRSSERPPYQRISAAERRERIKRRKRERFARRLIISVGTALTVFAVAMAVITTIARNSASTAGADFTRPEGGADIELLDATEAMKNAHTVEPKRANGQKELHKVTLSFYGREDMVCITPDIKVGDLLDIAEIELAENNVLKNDKETVISDDYTISVDEVNYDTVKVWEEIPFQTTYKNVQTVPRGQYKLIQAGDAGSLVKEYRVEMVNGQEVSRTLVSESVAQYPTTAVYEVGTGGTFTGKNGKTYSYSYYIDMTATYYTLESSPSDTTYTGIKVSNEVIAVDPKVIPLLTKVYVENEHTDYGERIAADIGGGIIGNKIDVFLEEVDDYFWWYGVIDVRVYILE